jgi:hypothetical protein
VKKLTMAMFLIFWCSSPWAAMYRCTSPDGKVTFQQTPCPSGEQKAIDSKARATVKAQERKQEEERLKKEKDRP